MNIGDMVTLFDSTGSKKYPNGKCIVIYKMFSGFVMDVRQTEEGRELLVYLSHISAPSEEDYGDRMWVNEADLTPFAEGRIKHYDPKSPFERQKDAALTQAKKQNREIRSIYRALNKVVSSSAAQCKVRTTGIGKDTMPF